MTVANIINQARIDRNAFAFRTAGGDATRHDGLEHAAAASESEKLRVLISYSRLDVAAADALVGALTLRGFDVKIDRRDLPFG